MIRKRKHKLILTALSLVLLVGLVSFNFIKPLITKAASKSVGTMSGSNFSQETSFTLYSPVSVTGYYQVGPHLGSGGGTSVVVGARVSLFKDSTLIFCIDTSNSPFYMTADNRTAALKAVYSQDNNCKHVGWDISWNGELPWGSVPLGAGNYKMTAQYWSPNGYVSNSYLRLDISDVALNPPAVPPIITFNAGNPSIIAGESTTLDWITTNATSCTINPGGISAVPVVGGSITITPTDTTVYTMSCTGAGGSNTAQTTITVSAVAARIETPSAFLKDLGYTTAETLLFTPSATKAIRQWGLLKGEGAISVDGGNTWQKSAAEVLYIGSMPQAHITKTGDAHYVVAGGTTEHTIRFYVLDNPGDFYSATVVDTINVVPADQASKVSIVSAIITPASIDCPGINAVGATVSPFLPNSKQLTFNFPNSKSGCTYEMKVKLSIDKTAASNTSINDSALITTPGGGKDEKPFSTLIIGPFAQERVGGDIYARGTFNFGDIPTGQFGAKYVLGADGTVQPTSEQGWILQDYSIRSGSTTDFSPDSCTSDIGYACKVMNDNIERLKKAKTDLSSFTSGFNLNPTPSLPEGKAFYRNGDLTIDNGANNATFSGKGTIVVENGNVYINSNMVYADGNSGKSMLGIIVKNGNVIIDPKVENVSAIFYIYSEKNPPNGNPRGSFIVKSNGVDDLRFTLTGAVVASGYSSGTKRESAFQLNRNYVGSRAIIEAAIIAKKTPAEIDLLLQSAELFLYDGRIILMPPPGFGGKIIGSF